LRKLTFTGSTKELDLFGGWGLEHCFHITSNLQIDFDEGGQSATTVSKTFNPWATTDAEDRPNVFQVHGRYHDSVVKSADGWRIATRRWENGWVSGWPAGQLKLLYSMTDISGS
jgi:hypothetical protein